jgi:membrane-associated phospholipid phosphatase
MISDVIVGLSVLFAAGWLLAAWLRPALRRRIEQPKFVFAQQIQRFDEDQQASNSRETPHEPR